MMQKLRVDCYKPSNCELGNDINPRDRECRLDKEKLSCLASLRGLMIIMR